MKIIFHFKITWGFQLTMKNLTLVIILFGLEYKTLTSLLCNQANAMTVMKVWI
jgi:hypothetical protein